MYISAQNLTGQYSFMFEQSMNKMWSGKVFYIYVSLKIMEVQGIARSMEKHFHSSQEQS